MWAKFACCFLFVSSLLFSYQQELLKTADVQVIMKQILAQHLGGQTLTTQLMQSAIKNYIEQFDPEKIYFLKEEVSPYLNLSPQELTIILQDYKNGNYSIFSKLNLLVKKAILRARLLRSQIETENKETLFQENVKLLKFNDYAKNPTQLKEYWGNSLKSFIHTQTKRYGKAATTQAQIFILHNYEENRHEFENQYLFQDNKGVSLAKSEEENLATLHILKALTSSLDSHSSFYQANEAYDIRMHLQKEFQGIGLTFEETPEGILVDTISENGPAAKSKMIKKGDILLTINGQKVDEISLEKVLDLLHDDKTTNIQLSFKRVSKLPEKTENFSVKLKKEVIVLNNDRVDVTYEKFGEGLIGVIKLHSFYQGKDITSEKDVQKAIDDLEKKGNLKGLILDLRDNRGGFLTQAIKVAGLFITNGVIVISKYADGQERFYRDIDGKVSYDGPLIILTSKITASAAEIVAQALQDYGVALVVGDEHTYGKGTIQTQTVTDDKSSSYFKVTVGKYYSPSGKTPQKNGIAVDIVVPSHWQHIEVGEKYANTVEADQIEDSFQDPLKDVKAELRPWYLKYYIPKLQHRTSMWRDLLPTLTKNSQYRIANNKNYQYYINGGKDMTLDPKEDLDWSAKDSNMNSGEDDLQLKEAINIIKDMSMLQTAKKYN